MITVRGIGINVSSDIIFGTENYIKCIARSGFDSLFTCGNDSEFISFVRKCCDDEHLRYEALHAPFDKINGLWFADSGQKVADELMYSVELASENSIKTVVTHLSSGENCPCVTDAGLKLFDKVVNFAANRNITVAVENQRKLGNIATVLEIYPKDSNVGFCWDVGHEKCFAHGKEFMPLFGDRCVTTHIHDNNMHYNVDEHLMPFDGSIDFRRTAELLRDSGYDKTLMLELHLPTADSERYSELSLEQFVHKAYAAINRLRIISE